jgi:hypothetical protein
MAVEEVGRDQRSRLQGVVAAIGDPGYRGVVAAIGDGGRVISL